MSFLRESLFLHWEEVVNKLGLKVVSAVLIKCRHGPKERSWRLPVVYREMKLNTGINQYLGV
jgi:hypothetical protein